MEDRRVATRRRLAPESSPQYHMQTGAIRLGNGNRMLPAWSLKLRPPPPPPGGSIKSWLQECRPWVRIRAYDFWSPHSENMQLASGSSILRPTSSCIALWVCERERESERERERERARERGREGGRERPEICSKITTHSLLITGFSEAWAKQLSEDGAEA